MCTHVNIESELVFRVDVSIFQKPTMIKTENGSSGWNFWSMVKSPSALLATYVRDNNKDHAPETPEREVEMMKLWVGLSPFDVLVGNSSLCD